MCLPTTRNDVSVCFLFSQRYLCNCYLHLFSLCKHQSIDSAKVGVNTKHSSLHSGQLGGAQQTGTSVLSWHYKASVKSDLCSNCSEVGGTTPALTTETLTMGFVLRPLCTLLTFQTEMPDQAIQLSEWRGPGEQKSVYWFIWISFHLFLNNSLSLVYLVQSVFEG